VLHPDTSFDGKVMTMRTILRGMLLFAVAAGLVLPGTPASAANPTIERFVHEPGAEEWFTLPDITCDGFTLTEEMTLERISVTTYLDGDGEPVKVALHANFFGVVTNSETLERYRDHATFSETEDLVNGTVTVSGASYHLVRGGAGQVYAEVGHKISMGFEGDLNFEILFQAGQTDYVDDGLDGLCSALA
jgi:hypothetical protein